MEFLTHHGREIAYQRFDEDGEGPTVLCIHGSGGTSDLWKAQARIRAEVPIVAIDLSGHGESDDIDTAFGVETLEAYADDVIAVAEATGATVLCGNSLGGAIAQWIAIEREFGSTLDGLVLQGTGAKLAVLDDLLEWLSPDGDLDRAIEFLHGEDLVFHDAPDEHVELSKRTMRETGRAVLERDFQTCDRFDVRDRVEAIETPSIAVVGEYDRLTPPKYHEYFAETLPHCERAVIEDAAHLAMIEQPDAFNAVLRDFVGRL